MCCLSFRFDICNSQGVQLCKAKLHWADSAMASDNHWLLHKWLQEYDYIFSKSPFLLCQWVESHDIFFVSNMDSSSYIKNLRVTFLARIYMTKPKPWAMLSSWQQGPHLGEIVIRIPILSLKIYLQMLSSNIGSICSGHNASKQLWHKGWCCIFVKNMRTILFN